MLTKTNPQRTYQENIELLTQTLLKLKRRRNRLGWVRLLVVLSILFFLYFFFTEPNWYTGIAVMAGVAFFLYVITIDTNNNNRIADGERHLAINNEELEILGGNYQGRDSGNAFLPDNHPYANDIDLFGKASVYQYINRCTSQQSNRFFADILLSASGKNVIEQRQEAAKSLAPHVEWRQRFQSLGIANPLTIHTQERIMRWLQLPAPFTTNAWKYLPNIFTAISLFSLVAYTFDWINSSVFTLLVFIYFLIAKYTSSKVGQTYNALSKIESEVDTIQQQLKQVETMRAESEILNSYKKTLILEKKGSENIKELKQILSRFDFRLNVFVFLFLNTFFLWDVRQVVSLNQWKQKNEASVEEWFTILSNIEVINTLATLTFNHPEWCFPKISDKHFTFVAKDLGHPLIPSSVRVNNSFSTQGTGKVSVITGSNMAGKSTFLRSLAVNLVLAQMGAPVCATAFTFSPVRLFSSMRIADNLAENTSTFYAELKKLKSIIDEVKQHEKLFILLDEILRGTNSLDRHTGSEALIRQLIKEDAVAVIATHDLELAGLENEYEDAISNYHFDVQVAGEELYFDYKLKTGVCESMNASILMKKIGIEI